MIYTLYALLVSALLAFGGVFMLVLLGLMPWYWVAVLVLLLLAADAAAVEIGKVERGQ